MPSKPRRPFSFPKRKMSKKHWLITKSAYIGSYLAILGMFFHTSYKYNALQEEYSNFLHIWETQEHIYDPTQSDLLDECHQQLWNMVQAHMDCMEKCNAETVQTEKTANNYAGNPMGWRRP